MSDVFISYKREDQARIVPIVEGLRKAGLSVWWDRDISAGLSWRQTISEQLETSRCVVVVWSVASVGPQGEFIHDEARRAKERGVLIPVRIDEVTEPIGFGEIHSLDLVGWYGSHRDPRFESLAEAAKALVVGGPRPRSATVRRIRLAAVWGSVSAISLGVLGFAADIARMQAQICKSPGIRAICAAKGLGGVPTGAEEALWAARAPGECAGLRTYLESFPNGAFAEEAARRLQAAETLAEERWVPEEQALPLTVRTTLDPLANQKAARADALKRAPAEASKTCEGFNTGEYRLVSASAEAQVWRCFTRGSGVVCGFDGQVICQVEARHLERREICR